MHRSLRLFTIFFAAFFLSQYASAADLPLPRIVARGKLPNQSAPIPTTTLWTPQQDGLYRLSIYMTLTTSGTPYSSWNYNLFWSDDAGAENIQSLLYQFDGSAWQFYQVVQGGNAIGLPIGGPTVVFEAKAGTPITFSVTQIGSPDGSVYSLYYTLERLE